MVRLRPFRIGDESAALAAHVELAREDFPFLLSYNTDEAWEDSISRWGAQRKGEQLQAGQVPSTFLAATVGGELVGRISIRHELNGWLAAYGGHIGYAIVPSQRRRGFATDMLRQGLIIARAVGVDDVLILCRDGNVASARVIERCGGAFESMIDNEQGGPPWRRYWIR